MAQDDRGFAGRCHLERDDAHVATDEAGHIYVTGLFGGAIDFGGSIRSTSSGSAFIASYDQDGALVWANDVGPDARACGLGIAATAMGDSYVVGNCSEGTLALAGTQLACNGSFIAAFGADGASRWAIPFVATSPLTFPKVAVTLDGGAALASLGELGGATGPFVAVLSPDGATLWSKSLAGMMPASAVVAPSGEIVAATDQVAFGFAPNGSVRWHFDRAGAGGYQQAIAITTTGELALADDSYISLFSRDGAPIDLAIPAVARARVLAATPDGGLAVIAVTDTASYLAMLSP